MGIVAAAHWHNTVGLPIWAVALAGLTAGFLAVVIQLRRARLSTAQKYILGAMLRRNEAILVAPGVSPTHVQAGGLRFCGPRETRTESAPVTEKYLDAFSKLQSKGWIREYSPHSPTWVLSDKGMAMAKSLPPRFKLNAGDIVGG